MTNRFLALLLFTKEIIILDFLKNDSKVHMQMGKFKQFYRE